MPSILQRLHLLVLLLAFTTTAAQQYTYKARYDSLDTRPALSRPLIERYFITGERDCLLVSLLAMN